MVSISNPDSPDNLTTPNNDSDIVVPLHIEEASISKRQVETGRVRVSTVTRQHEQLIQEALAREEVQIERKAINQLIDRIPPVREDGDIIIVPIVEEVLVVERKLMLKEEVHVKRVHGTEQFQQRVLLRKQEVVVERIQAAASDSSAGSGPGVTPQPQSNKEM
jgi:uncharacterized protein (TIGR02271 family)